MAGRRRTGFLRPRRGGLEALPALLVVILAALILGGARQQRAEERLIPLEMTRNTADMAMLAPAASPEPIQPAAEEGLEVTYVLNANTRKFHRPDCQSVLDMKPKNRRDFTGTRDEAVALGYAPCKRCNP